ncbi:MAG: acyltransferase family protein [Bacteriovoracaceae bacterium]|jgi:1-acyl-sn-glycerol-3-phosphate acyltransferase|nr:acyltransferase family protein [Bacteriovoracaceae bacterium]
MINHFNLKLSDEDKQKKDELINQLRVKYKDYKDPWGFNIESISKALDFILPLYKNYFRVRVFGKENVQNEPYMLVSNHTGQIPIDGVLITTAFAMEIEPPRVVHSMVERFLAGLPFLGDLTAQTGSILGDRENCKWLLKNNESILVFPEGVRGISKASPDFYKLQKFSHGFYRIAASTKTKILPISVVGAEEMYPFVFHLKKIGKKFGLPSLPLTLNLLPLPSPIDIYIGEPIDISGQIHPESTDEEIREHVYKIEKKIKQNLSHGLKNRRPFFNKIRKPVQDLIFRMKS